MKVTSATPHALGMVLLDIRPDWGDPTGGGRVQRRQRFPRLRTIAAGDGFTLPLDNDGNVWSVGYSDNGSLGVDFTDNLTTPQKILSGGEP